MLSAAQPLNALYFFIVFACFTVFASEAGSTLKSALERSRPSSLASSLLKRAPLVWIDSRRNAWKASRRSVRVIHVKHCSARHGAPVLNVRLQQVSLYLARGCLFHGLILSLRAWRPR